MAELEIIVGTHRGDFDNAKILCESIRYFCGDMPILLLVDGNFDASQILRLGNVRIFDRRPLPSELQRLSGLYTKLQAFFHPEYDRFLYMDADTLLVQDVLTLPFRAYDFFVNGGVEDIDEPATRRRITQLCFDVERLRAFDDTFPYRELVTFNTGQFFGRTGFFTVDQVMQCVRNSKPLLQNGLFKYGDQGILNYLFNKGAREKRFALGAKQFAIFPSWEPPEQFPDLNLDNVMARRYKERALIHFTSTRRARFKDYPFGEVVIFFYQRYYSRFPQHERIGDEFASLPKTFRRLAREYVRSKPWVGKLFRVILPYH